MGTRNHPGAFDCYVNAESDEPMFVLLGRDRHAPVLVRNWAALREAAGEDASKVAEAIQCADAMEAFRGQREKLDVLVVEAMINARDNGYDVDSWPPRRLASDMKRYDAALERYDDEAIVASIERVRRHG